MKQSDAMFMNYPGSCFSTYNTMYKTTRQKSTNSIFGKNYTLANQRLPLGLFCFSILC